MSETINQRIRRLRKQCKYTQSDMAQFLNINQPTYSQMERKGNINAQTLIKLSEILEVDPIVILYGEGGYKRLNKEAQEFLEKAEKEKDIPEIPILITKNVREKLTLIAMRRLTADDSKEIYKFVLEKLKYL